MTLAPLVLTALSLLQAIPTAVATFEGMFKTTNGKFVEVQVPGGDTMRMHVTRETRFIREGRPVKPAAFHDGDPVTVEARRDIRMNLLAVRITLTRTASQN